MHVAVLELVFVVLLKEDGADEADDAVLVGEDADDICTSPDFTIEPFSGIIRPVFLPH